MIQIVAVATGQLIYQGANRLDNRAAYDFNTVRKNFPSYNDGKVHSKVFVPGGTGIGGAMGGVTGVK